MAKSVKIDDLALVVSGMLHRIRERESSVVLRADFDDLGGSGLVDDALDSIMSQNELVKIGDGVFTRARTSALSGKPVPDGNFKLIALEALDRLGVKWDYSEGERLYREGKVLQIPGGIFVVVEGEYRPYIGISGTSMKIMYWNDESRQWE